MSKSIKSIVSSAKNLTNVQKVAKTLLTHKGEWVASSVLRKVTGAPNRDASSARVRELRNKLAWNIETASASDLNRPGGQYTFYYRLSPASVRVADVRELFGV